MGWDIKATTDAVGEVLNEAQSLEGVKSLLPSAELFAPYGGINFVFGIVAAVAFAIAVLFVTDFGRRLRRVVSDVFFTNWQLALLGTSALLLSIAGGWTTWDGMTNFTGEPVLSLMFTFGIHGVMLIVAWLIGESFATGMSTVSRGGFGRVATPLIVIIGLGVVLLATAAGVYEFTNGIPADTLMRGLMIGGAVVLSVGLLAAFAKTDILAPYAQALRIIAKNSMLWVMFFACMATSVFFSFDSRFNVIFPKDQRERAAEIRTKNQIAAVVADIGETIGSRRIVEAETFFASEGWKAYETQLVNLAKASEGADADIEAHFVKQLEGYRRNVAEQQERIATAGSGQAGLASKKATLTDELSRLKSERPTLAAEHAQKKTELENRAKEVDSKRVEAMAEDKGVEGTGKEGKGPVWRERMGEMGKLKEYYKIGEERVKDAQKRLDAGDQRIAQIERELAGVDGELAKLKGESDTASLRIKAAEESQLGQDGPRVDPARVRGAFEKARTDFRQRPDHEHLGSLQQHCAQLYDAMISTDATKERVRSVDCDPKQASEAAAVLFALNTGLKAFDANCAGGDKVAAANGTEGLLQFGRKCLQDSGLSSKDSNDVATRISAIDLNRDDKAHNFVVSLNAFQDGNRLAYLALAIAIGIDSLIFMAGLFGANAIRSPLSDVPSSKARNAQQLEAIIENALLPDRFENASVTLEAMSPITPRDGFTAEVVLPSGDNPARHRIMKVLNAGATIGAVERDEMRPSRYLVRPELFEFLSIVAKRAYEDQPDNVTIAELEKVVAVALLPVDKIGANAETVLSFMHPINEDRGFTAEIRLSEVVDPKDLRLVRNTLNAAATVDRVQRQGNDAQNFFIHRDLYKTLARLRARAMMSVAHYEPRAQIGGPSLRDRDGGALREDRATIDYDRRSPPQLTARGNVDEEHLRSEFRSALLKAISVGDQSFLLATRSEFVGSAIAAGRSLDQLKETKSPLGLRLKAKDVELRGALDRTYKALWARQGDDAQRIEVLNETSQEMEHLLPALMLTPRGPYESLLWQIINELEDQAGQDGGLNGREQLMLDRLREHASDLALVNRDQPDSWNRLQKLCDQAAQLSDTVASRHDPKRHLN